MSKYHNTFLESLTIFLPSVGKTENEKEFDSRTTSGSDFKRRLTFFRFYLIKQTFFSQGIAEWVRRFKAKYHYTLPVLYFTETNDLNFS